MLEKQEKQEGDAERRCSELTRTPVPHLPTPLGPRTEVVEESVMKV